jgi:hypothetical protein
MLNINQYVLKNKVNDSETIQTNAATTSAGRNYQKMLTVRIFLNKFRHLLSPPATTKQCNPRFTIWQLMKESSQFIHILKRLATLLKLLAFSQL